MTNIKVGEKVKWICGKFIDEGEVTRVVDKHMNIPYTIVGDLFVRCYGDNYSIVVHSSLVQRVKRAA